MHRALGVARLERGPDRQRADNGIVDRLLLFQARPVKNVVRDLLFGKRTLARVADADSEPPEGRRPERCGDILEPIVTGAAAAFFELHRAWLQVELVVRDQDLLRCNAIETRQRGHRLAASVHKGLRQCQSPIDAVVRSYAGNEGLKLRLHTERRANCLRQALDEPRARVMPGRAVFAAGVAYPD